MADDYWSYPVGGDWEDADNWSGGLPGAGDVAHIDAPGGYTVTLASAQAIGGLVLAGNTLHETAQGSLTSPGDLSLLSASLILDAANAGLTGTLTAEGDSIVSVTHDGALGSLAVTLEGGSELHSGRTTTIGNDIDFGVDATLERGTVSASDDTTLTLTGALTFDETVTFGTSSDAGTIVLAPSAATSLSTAPFIVAAGTLKLGNATAAGLIGSGGNALLFGPLVAAGATLDLAGQNAGIDSFDNRGTITNSGAVATFTLQGDAAGGGAITGNIQVAVDSAAPVTYTGSLALTAFGGLTLSDSDNMEAASIADSLTITGAVSVARSGSISVAQFDILTIDGTANLSGSIALDGELHLAGSSVLKGAISGGGSVLVENGATVEMDGPVATSVYGNVVQGATLIIDHAGGFRVVYAVGGTLIADVTNASAGGIVLYGGSFLSNSGGFQGGALVVGGTGVVSIAHNKSLIYDGSIAFDGSGTGLTIGTAGNDGTLVYDLTTDSSSSFGALTVAFGTLQIGLNTILPGRCTVAAGAKLDLAGHAVEVVDLQGSGSVTSQATTTLELFGANFAGTIAGKTSVEIFAPSSISVPVSPTSVFTGANTYTGATTIDAGAIFSLGLGGTTGSIASKSIVDNGRLTFNHSDSLKIAGKISGTGMVDQRGAGATTLNGHDSYSGGTLVEHGTLIAENNSRLGTGDVTITGGELSVAGLGNLGSSSLYLRGGELLERGTATLGGTFHFQGSTDIAVTHGQTLTLQVNDMLDASTTLTFGDATHDGTILWDSTGFVHNAGSLDLRVMSGTLALDDATAATTLGQAASAEIDASATLDLGGFSATINLPGGTGTITNSGVAAELTFASQGQDAEFSFAGAIGGALTVDVEGETLTLSGPGSFTKLELLDATGSAAILGSASEAVQFDDDGIALVLGASAQLTGHIIGFGDDAIDLRGVAFGGSTHFQYAKSTHTLTVTDGTHSVALVFDGRYTKADFAIQSDDNGDTLVGRAGSQAARIDEVAFAHATPAAFAAAPVHAFGDDQLTMQVLHASQFHGEGQLLSIV